MFNSTPRDRDFYFDAIVESDLCDALLADAAYFKEPSDYHSCYFKDLEARRDEVCYPFYEEF